MKIHACFLDKGCREHGIIWRVSVWNSKRWYGVAFTPGDRFVTRKKDVPPYVRGELYNDSNYHPTWFRFEKRTGRSVSG